MRAGVWKILTGALLVSLIVFQITVKPVSADIAPPAEPPGANPIPGNESTFVRMMEETVRIAIQPDGFGESLGQALVRAEFIMRNLGDTAESMAVRFPLGVPDGWGNIAVIDEIDVWVDGSKVSTREISGSASDDIYEDIPWSEFDVLFPVGEDVHVTVEYALEGTGELPYIWFGYVFSTGAAWKDAIGQAKLIVSFPYEVNDLFLLYCIDNLSNCTVPGGVIEGREITWTYSEFEPQREDDFMIAFAAPSVWQKVLEEKDRLADVPGDGEAWGRLGMVYKSLIFSPHGWRGFRNYLYLADPGVEQLFQLADHAYSQAVTLLPDDALWHAGYAELLGYYAEYAGYEGVDTLSLKVKSLQELHRALELAPEDEKVIEIAYGLSWLLQEGLVIEDESFDFLWLTETPVATLTPTEMIIQTETPAPSPTQAVEVEPTKTTIAPTENAVIEATGTTDDESNGIKDTPICAGAILLPIILIAGAKMGHNWGRK